MMGFELENTVGYESYAGVTVISRGFPCMKHKDDAINVHLSTSLK